MRWWRRPVRQIPDTWKFETLENRSDLISNVCVLASGSQAWSKCRADTHVTALAKGSKASKGAKDCFTELRAAEALPPHRRSALTRRSGHCRLSVATPSRGNPLTPRATFATFARIIPSKPNPLPLAKPIPAFARCYLCIAANLLVFTSPMTLSCATRSMHPCH